MKVKGLPGHFRQRNNRWSWQVKLPGTKNYATISLKPLGAQYATTDKNVAIEIAREIYQKSILKTRGKITDHTVASICQQYLEKEAVYYSKSEKGMLKLTSKRLIAFCGTMKSEDFTPFDLKGFRETLLKNKKPVLARTSVNRYTNMVKRIFAWAVSEGLTPASVHHGLTTVKGLRKGRTTAPEMPDIEPVDDIDVERTIDHTTPVVADMIRLQELTAMRGGEMVIIRPCDIDRANEVWIYTPSKHKTAHLGHEHPIQIGPKAQKILMPYLLRKPKSFCFSPLESQQQRGRSNVKDCGDRYTTCSYRRAIEYAIKKGNKAHGKDYIKHWTPHQLRHTAATKIRDKLGIEAACAILGHADITATQIYARMRKETATEAARQLG